MMTTNDQEKTQVPTSRSPGCLKKLVAAASLAPILLFVASQLGRYSFVCELISNFQRFIFLSLLPCPFILLFLGMKRWALVTALPLVWSLALVSWVYLPPHAPPEGEEKIRVMSFNVLAKNPNHSEVLKEIQRNDPDVLLVLEYSLPWASPFKALDESYPYQVTVPKRHGFGIALFSKIPINRSSIVQLTPNRTDDPAIVAHLQIGDQELRLVGAHVASPIDFSRLEIRNQQYEDISRLLSQTDEPTVLIGDLNCAIWSPFLQDLMRTSRLRDSRQGFGHSASWHAQLWPFQIPIDHALVSKHVHVHDRSVGKNSAGSDHFPIFTEVSISPK